MRRNLLSVLRPQSQLRLLEKAVVVGLGVALLTLASRVQVPFWPVPMTLQTLAVLMVGATAGARLGVTTVLAWLALGAVGVPVFATGAGFAYMAGPTGGYLLGFLLAVLCVGQVADKGEGRTLGSAFLLLALGDIVIFAAGIAWLSLLLGPAKAVSAGLVPFIPAEILKLALGTAVLTAAWRKAQG